MNKKKFDKWWNNLYKNTTSYKFKTLIDANDKFTFIKIKHPGSYGASGFTQHLVTKTYQDFNSFGLLKTILWSKEGRILKADRLWVAMYYGLGTKK